jgi:hypothetical protein
MKRRQIEWAIRSGGKERMRCRRDAATDEGWMDARRNHPG